MNDTTEFSLSITGESLASEYMVRKGYSVIQKNYHSPYGEIDLIVRDDTELVFVEVKARNNHDLKAAEASITFKKQKRIIRTAQHYITQNSQYSDFSCRFDVVIVFRYPKDNTYKVLHYPNAFNLSYHE